MKNSTVMNLIN